MNRNTEKLENIRRLWLEGMSQAEIARLYNVSRQRIGQIVHYYSTHSGYASYQRIRDFILKKEKKTCQWGEKCRRKKGEANEIHHLDGNCWNNRLSNLFLLCKKCHSFFHSLKREHFIGDDDSLRPE